MRVFCVALAAVVAVAAVATMAINATPLDDYVNKPDSCFKWTHAGAENGAPVPSFNGLDYMGYTYQLRSQCWMTPEYSDRHEWWHELVIVVPNKLNPTVSDSAFMYITGGDEHQVNDTNKMGPTDEGVFVTAAVAVDAGIIGATLRQVPAEPITFSDDPWHKGSRTEDAAIALTWYQYMNMTKYKGNAEVVLELPMTKAAVKALTAVQEIAPKYNGGKAVKNFGVGGASKRGWTTWLTAAVDSRVKVAIPIVLDAINVHKFLHYQWRELGCWTFALEDYWHANVTVLVDTPAFKQLMSFIDPISYADRLTMPGLEVQATGDEFQNAGTYWSSDVGHKLPGIKHILAVKNADHTEIVGLLDGEVLTSVTAFVLGYLHHTPAETIPTYKWNITNDGKIIVQTSQPPSHIDVAYSDSALGVSKGKRDWRFAAIEPGKKCPLGEVFGACIRPVLWWTPRDTSAYIKQIGTNTYEASVPMPPAGQWRAFLVDIKFKDPFGKDKYWFTSPTTAIPETLPFPPCVGEGCHGQLC